MRAPLSATLVLAVWSMGLGCASNNAPARTVRNSVTIVPPHCREVSACVLGHVTAAGSTAPVAKATVFLERELQPGETEPLRLYGLTDELGVFSFENPPAGNYRLAVYKEDSSVELGGLELGELGTTMLPIRLVLESLPTPQ